MLKNATFAVIACFWVVMNALLWHSEIGSGSRFTSSVPPASIWERILRAPDASTLSIQFQDKKVGYLRIQPRAEGTAPTGQVASGNEPEGIVRDLSEYTLEVDGSFVAPILARSIRVQGDFVFNRDLAWERLNLDAQIRPATWNLQADARKKELWIKSAEGETEWIHRMEFAELANPRALLAQIDSPLVAALLPQLLPANATNATGTASLRFNLNWEGRYEWLRVGSSRVRIYRLEARLLDRHRITVLVSRVGEILRVEFPGELTLVNESLFTNLQLHRKTIAQALVEPARRERPAG